jgi:hypothetical protein
MGLRKEGGGMNVIVEYLYRDAGNNKVWAEVVFHNTKNIDVVHLDAMLRNSLIDRQFFVAEDLEVPALAFDRYDAELDHGWHEFVGVYESEEPPTGRLGGEITEFVELMNKSADRRK